MVHFGVMFMGRALAIQYGDGLALTEFWRAGMHWFNVLKKVVKNRICFFTDSLIFQYKYRIQAHQKVAAAEGVHGKSIAIDTVFNSLVNDKGCRNTNKAGDLKVREAAVNCYSTVLNCDTSHPRWRRSTMSGRSAPGNCTAIQQTSQWSWYPGNTT